jgi:hypothetical protein
MKVLMSLVLFFTLTQVSFASNLIATSISCNDYGDYYVGEACLIKIEDINSGEQIYVATDLYKFFQNHGLSNHPAQSPRSVFLDTSVMRSCVEDELYELRLDLEATNCYITPASAIKVLF